MSTTTRHHLQPGSTTSAPPSVHVPPARPFVLLPLYIYPGPGAWDPLHEAAAARPELDFWVVVNPANGPGESGQLPDANYVRELARLTATENVKVIGYVHCSYGRRPAEDIVADVEGYGKWEGLMSQRAVEGESIIVDGIFIDEVPSSTEFVEYMAALATSIKTTLNRNIMIPNPASSLFDKTKPTATGTHTTTATSAHPEEEEEPAPVKPAAAYAALAASAAAHKSNHTSSPATPPPGGALTPLSSSSAVVIYNPGVVVDPIFYQAADYVVAFENAAAAWRLPVVSQGLSRLPRSLLPRSVVIAHSASGGGVKDLSRRAAERGCVGQFVTGRAGYTEWCEDWMEFVGEMADRTRI